MFVYCTKSTHSDLKSSVFFTDTHCRIVKVAIRNIIVEGSSKGNPPVVASVEGLKPVEIHSFLDVVVVAVVGDLLEMLSST